MQRHNIHARCRVSLATTAAAVVGVLALSGCESVPDYANPVEWYKTVVDTFDSEDADAPAPPAPEVGVAADAPAAPAPEVGVAADAPAAPAPEIRTDALGAPSDIVAEPGGPTSPRTRTRVAAALTRPAPAALSPFDPSAEIAATPTLSSPAAAPALRPAQVPGASQPFPSLSSVPETSPSETRQTELSSVAQGLVADREHARYTSETFRRERAGLPALAPPPAPAPAPATALAAVAPAVQTPRPPSVSTPPPGAAVDVTEIFGRNFSASGPYAVAPPVTETQYAGTPALPMLLPPLSPVGTPAISDPYFARNPPGPGGLAAYDPSVTAAASNIAVLHFNIGSAALSAKDRKALRAIVNVHRARGGIVRVVGHASSRTRELPIDRHNLVNFDISQARAQAVANQLIRLGVAPRSVFISAKSDAEPIYYEWMPSGEAGNRRVEVFIDF